ncbi:hypothetical protein TWF694_006732 [Orbilia ellipsospora]|uniref:Extracellular membrane protein CFEM domain-containing protein n=1 Tax=Orbilia ellipsospora TaxID=2528407 RepID=A0AAV9XLX6_9PEZI
MLSGWLLGLLVVQSASNWVRSLACSTTSFNETYSIYPDCAASCIACQDADYVQKFANNCDYVSGDCCSSQYHSAIAATWACVRSICGVDVKTSQDAFDLFVQYCANQSVPLAAADVPTGYNFTNTSSSGRGSPSNSNTGNPPDDSSSLQGKDIAGIVLGTVGGLGSLIGTYYAWRQWKKRKIVNSGGGNQSSTAIIHQPQRPFDFANPGIWANNAGVKAVYTRRTATLSLTSGLLFTEERVEVDREGLENAAVPPAATRNIVAGRVLGEVEEV